MVELLVGLTIFVVVVAAVVGAAATGLKVYDEARTYRVAELRLAISLETFESRLRSAQLSQTIPFTGDGDGFRFFGMASFPDPDSSALRTVPTRIGYRFDEGALLEELDPYTRVVGLDLKNQSASSRTLAQNVHGNFRYYAYSTETETHEWTNAWDAPDELPLAVLITLYLNDEEHPFAQRIVTIPVAGPQLKFAEAETP